MKVIVNQILDYKAFQSDIRLRNALIQDKNIEILKKLEDLMVAKSKKSVPLNSTIKTK